MTTNALKIPVHLGDLTGSNGNAFAIMGAVSSSGRQLRVSVDHILAEMQTGDYEHLLDTVLLYCDDLDGSIEDLREQENFDLDEEDE